MAHYMMQVALHNTSLLPRDDAVNVLWFDINAPDTLIGTMDDVKVAYEGQGGRINPVFSGMTIKCYEPAGGAPVAVKNYVMPGGGTPTPTEVALCLSYSAVDAAAGAPRFRGRIYLPFSAATARPTLDQVQGLLAFGQNLASAGNAGNTTWKMRSRLGTGTAANPVPVFRKIESISVDNEWDTQRRRGMRATSRTRQDVQ